MTAIIPGGALGAVTGVTRASGSDPDPSNHQNQPNSASSDNAGSGSNENANSAESASSAAPPAAGQPAGGASAETVFNANTASGDATEAPSDADAAARGAAQIVAEAEAETLQQAIETATATGADGSVDERLNALTRALEVVEGVPEGGGDSRIEALFAKVDAVGTGDNAGGRPERFESFGADRRESFASASNGYAASKSATGAQTSSVFKGGA